MTLTLRKNVSPIELSFDMSVALPLTILYFGVISFVTMF